MGIPYKMVLADKIVKQSTFASSVFFVITLVYLAIVYRNLPPFVPLYNQLPWGVGRLGDKMMIFVPVFMAVSFFLVNMGIAKFVYEKMPLVVRMMSITTFFISFVTFIFIIRVTLLVL